MENVALRHPREWFVRMRWNHQGETLLGDDGRIGYTNIVC